MRQLALDAAYRAHPARFPNGPPRVALPPTEVFINPITSDAISVVAAASVDVPAGTVDVGVSSNPTGPLVSATRATQAGGENFALTT